VTVADLRERAARDFQLEGFRDFLVLDVNAIPASQDREGSCRLDTTVPHGSGL